MMHQVTRPVLDFPTLAMQCSAVRHHWSDTLKGLESHNHQWTKSTTFATGTVATKEFKQKFIVSISFDGDGEIKVKTNLVLNRSQEEKSY